MKVATVALVAAFVALAAPAWAAAPPLPVLLVHGLGGSSLDFDTMRVRLEAAGFPPERIHAVSFPMDWNLSNRTDAELLAAGVERVRRAHGVARVNIVAHSMGNLAVRYFLEVLGGTSSVHGYVSLGAMHHGLGGPCTSLPLPSIVPAFDELCAGGAFMTRLGARPTAPAVRTVSIYSADDGVVPAESAYLEGAENFEVSGVAHSGRYGLLEDRAVFALVLPYLL
jgi:triacylglycerol lipase